MSAVTSTDTRSEQFTNLPGVLVYQAFSYWVFRRRVASERITS